MRPDRRDIVEIGGVTLPEGDSASAPRAQARPFLSLYFSCANAYARAYKTSDGACYQGRCPRCAKSIDFPIGHGGTSRRMFEVRCD